MRQRSPLQSVTKTKLNFFNSKTPSNKQNQSQCNNSPFVCKKSSNSYVSQNKKHSCFNCGKEAYYKESIYNKHYCASCSIDQMMKGSQIIDKSNSPIKLVDSNKKIIRSQSNFDRKSNRQMELIQFINCVQRQEEKINIWIQNSDDNQYSIREKYNKKKIEIKKYYQKIEKAVINSMVLDIEMLEIIEKQQLYSFKQAINSLKKDSLRLNDIGNDLKPNLQNIIDRVEQFKYLQFMEKYKFQVNRIGKLTQKTMETFPKDNINLTIEDKSYYFDPQFYRTFENLERGREIDGHENGIIFSFQRMR